MLPLIEPLLPPRRDFYTRPVTWTKLTLRPFSEQRPPVAFYERTDATGSGVAALRNSPYWRVWQLAQRLRKDAPTPYEYARRVDAYLDNGFRYDEGPPGPRAGLAPLDAFLFDSKAGYCQHFSGAMALLLRLGGVPARVATGFSPGGFKRSQDEWVIRDRDAHSWVEAWYDGIGWVTFDPTPSATPARSLIAALNEEKAPEAADDAAVTASGGNAPGRNPAGGLRGIDPGAPAAAAAPAAQQHGSFLAAAVLGGAALVALLAGIALHRRRARRRPSVSEAERALVELVRALRRAGRPIAPRDDAHRARAAARLRARRRGISRRPAGGALPGACRPAVAGTEASVAP